MSAVPAEVTDETTCVHPEAVAAARRARPDERCVERATAALTLVGDPTRRSILSALTRSELRVCDLASVIRRSEGATRHQGRLQRTGRVVTPCTVGLVVYGRLLDHQGTTLTANALVHAGK
ncbi:ArsR family transcriptional regulator [Deinococcus kurensis]|uniref:ArsR family transcriptional regulator n=1 Tax=Deinococcus kurensis TaxID=2662757 RepID=UPI0012D337E3|nr:ArsR family transcriptional regulator [Deinococcus kurensis]